VLANALIGSGCGDTPTEAGEFDWAASGARYVRDINYRRSSLENSLVNPANGYSALRLANFANTPTAGWDALPYADTTAASLLTSDIRANGSLSIDVDRFVPITVPDPARMSDADWIELGRQAFFNYPLQRAPTASMWFQQPDRGASRGLEPDVFGRVGGLVAVRENTGEIAPYTTCSTCHGDIVQGVRVAGRVNDTWFGGRLDVTPDGIDNPTGITDLRPISLQTHLHAAGTLVNSPAALAVRIDTLITTSAGERTQPPEAIAWALARYLWSLESTLPPVEPSAKGADIFDANCGSCHSATGPSVEPVPLDWVGTDPAVGESPDRGTGFWRVPSLRGVSQRSQFLHTANFRDLPSMFAPDRDASIGHTFGLNLSDSDRNDLLTFLEGI
jgi:mono/diheme cytochrome c family protein